MKIIPVLLCLKKLKSLQKSEFFCRKQRFSHKQHRFGTSVYIGLALIQVMQKTFMFPMIWILDKTPTRSHLYSHILDKTSPQDITSFTILISLAFTTRNKLWLDIFYDCITFMTTKLVIAR